MSGPKFVFLGEDARREFETTVSVQVPGAGRQQFTAKFLDLPQSKLLALTEGDGDSDALLQEVLTGWSGIEDKNGKPLPFEPQFVEAVLDFAYVKAGLYDAYFDAVAGRNSGNF